MRFSASVEGVTAVTSALGGQLQKLKREGLQTTYVVGYTASYALYQHEDLSYNHTVGQAKFLEQPARTNVAKYRQIIKDKYRETGSLTQGLIAAGSALLADSQQLVPVLTGFLKSTGFSKLE